MSTCQLASVVVLSIAHCAVLGDFADACNLYAVIIETRILSVENLYRILSLEGTHGSD